ncbi:hypothetical protein ACU5AY_07105 [Rhizobium sp. PAMB 3174]
MENRTMRLAAPAATSLLMALALAACQSKPPAPVGGSSALSMMERVAIAANTCWFKSGDPAFTPYRLAPELNSFSGRPRILVVHKHKPESLPLLVVQAEGSPAKLSAFGPLLAESSGSRINADVNRWASGQTSC